GGSRREPRVSGDRGRAGRTGRQKPDDHAGPARLRPEGQLRGRLFLWPDQHYRTAAQQGSAVLHLLPSGSQGHALHRPARRAGGRGQERQEEGTQTGSRRAVNLAPDALSATFEKSLADEFTWRLVLEAEHGIATGYDAQVVHMIKDTPPVIKYDGKEDLR